MYKEITAQTLMQMNIIVSTPCQAWLKDLPSAVTTGNKVVKLTLAQAELGCDLIEVGVTLTDDAEMRVLNRDYGGQDKVTNVLSFSGQDFKCSERHGPLLLGDIVLAHGIILEEARQQGKLLYEHYCHLLVHGTLHLLGHDHIDAEEAAKMESTEISILAAIGIADPYEFSSNIETLD